MLLSVGFGQLVGTMTLLSSVATMGNAAKIGILAGGMILLASAMVICRLQLNVV